MPLFRRIVGSGNRRCSRHPAADRSARVDAGQGLAARMDNVSGPRRVRRDMNPAELREARLLDRLLDTLLDLPEVERRKRLSQLQATRPQIARKLERLVALAEGEVAALQPAGALKTGMLDGLVDDDFLQRSEERRVGKEGRGRLWRE